MNKAYPIYELGILKPLMQKYAQQESELDDFINHFPSLDAYKAQIKEKSNHSINREVLKIELLHQYQNNSISNKTKANIDKLIDPNTFTVTTGHQPCLFTGPLYFIIKILQTIKLAAHLDDKIAGNSIVPIFWMGAEDHDFEEVNHFNLYRKKLNWESEQKGAVGRFSTQGLDGVAGELSAVLNDGRNEDELRSLFQKAYVENENYGEATRYLVNELFGDRGLVIIDADSQVFKKELKLTIVKEIKTQLSCSSVDETCANLSEYGKVQVKSRLINLFYMDESGRDRIILNGDSRETVSEDLFRIDNRDLEFSRDELLIEVEKHPEKFSPNVLLRPIYQELLLPNLAYIGGPGETAYWLELKKLFENLTIPMPIVELRNSIVFIPKRQLKKLENLGLEVKDLFADESEWSAKLLESLDEEQIDFAKEHQQIGEILDEMKAKAIGIDPTMKQVFEGEKIRLSKTLGNLEKRVYKAQKRKNSDKIEQIKKIKEKVFPGGVLQERKENFATFYASLGSALFDVIYEALDPEQAMVTVVVL
jgi:bacillithiol biosynthesis cysteine-adding enzyme BshC